jgi:hypothetical protein
VVSLSAREIVANLEAKMRGESLGRRALLISAPLAVALAAALSAQACLSNGPLPDTTHVLHIQNWTNEAVAVDISTHLLSVTGAADDFSTAVRPCSGPLDLSPGAGIPSSHWFVLLLRDPTGRLDADLAQWTGDPHDLPGQYDGMAIIWSRGDIATSDLPRWITVAPGEVLLTDAPPEAPASPSCGPAS